MAEKIHDNRFLRLMRNMLKAGYLEDWEYHDTLSGVPQGGTVSPVLSNIYLDKLDKFVEQELIPQYTRGARRRLNPEYNRRQSRLRRARKRGDRAEARDLQKQLRTLPRDDPMDPGYRRLKYIRYADDHILGFIGPKAEAEEIKARLAAFLRETLGLELNQAKTLITHARTQRARFLGYDITVWHCNTKITSGRRSANGKIALKVPPDVIKAQCARYRKHGKPWHRSRLQNLDDYDIVRTYGAEYRGVVNYYLLAQDVSAAHPPAMERPDLDAEDPGRQAPLHRHQDGGPLQGQDRDQRRTEDLLRGQEAPRGQAGPGSTIRRDPPAAEPAGGHPRPRARPGTLSPQGADQTAPQTECELCETGTTVAVHQVTGLKELGKPGPGQPAWAALMAKMRRKTLIVCADCHEHIHAEPRRARGINRWKAQCTERCTLSLEGGCPEKARVHPR